MKILNQKSGNADQKRIIGEQIWLHYYNRTLFEAGLITEQEKNRMANRINARIALGTEKKYNWACR